MAKKPTRDTFMADAERLLRKYFDQHTDLVVWRGEYPRTIMNSTSHFDTIVVGLVDDKESKEPPPLVLLKVWLEGSWGGVSYDFDDGAGGSQSGTVPFGGGWNPVEEIEKFVIQLKELQF